MIGGERAEDEADGGHVFQAMVAVGGIRERAGLVDDAHRGFVRGDLDALDLVEPVAHERVQRDRGLDGGLRVELGGEGDFEEDVLHHVAAERARELDRLAAEEHVAEAPRRRRERAGVAHLAAQGA